MNGFLIITLLTQMQSAALMPCQPAASAPALDHAIIAVRDLQRATQNFRTAGFKIKRGRLHTNGLLNNHIKFPNGGEIELMTVQGPPRDEMARDYASLLSTGEGGVYVALKVSSLKSAEQHASQSGLPTRHSASGRWQFVSFPPSSPAAAVFFTSGGVSVQDADSIFRHDPSVNGLSEIWLEGDAVLADLLHRLGAAECGTARSANGQHGQRWTLKRGSLVIVPMGSNSRPRVLGAVLTSAAATSRTIRPLPEFWIEYRSP